MLFGSFFVWFIFCLVYFLFDAIANKQRTLNERAGSHFASSCSARLLHLLLFVLAFLLVVVVVVVVVVV